MIHTTITRIKPEVSLAHKIQIEDIPLEGTSIEKIEVFKEGNRLVVFYYTEDKMLWQIGQVAEKLSVEQSTRDIIEATLGIGEHLSCPPVFELDSTYKELPVEETIKEMFTNLMNAF